MDFPKLSSPSLKDLFIQEIENMILSGKLSVGDRLPPERELAEKMSISRTVVNSGLSELSRLGFIEILPRVGAVVSDYNRKGTMETLNAILRYKGGVLTNQEMKALLEIRLAIENLAIELAFPQFTEENLENLNRHIENFASSSDPVISSERIFTIHHEICILSGNSLLPVVFYSFRTLALSMWERYFRIHGNSTLIENTKELYQCFQKRNLSCALETFRTSIMKTLNGIDSIYNMSS